MAYITHQEWAEKAACIGIPTDMFFLELEEGATDEEKADYRDTVKSVKKICAGCPVKAECLDAALENDERAGIWGGKTPQQRIRMRRIANRAASIAEVSSQIDMHGTERSYQAHLRLGSRPCPECRRAHARHIADVRARKKVG